jgi:hypothetical protein
MVSHLGFFADFKGADVVLWAGSANDVARLMASIEQFASSTEDALAIHTHTVIAQERPTQLFLCRPSWSANNKTPNQFRWRITPRNLSEITSKLAALASSEAGQQHFVLAESNTELIVSVGEYPDSWWDTNG